MKRSRRTGFTIIELLITMSIIALLIAILLPAVEGARNQAKQALSQTNLRNLGTAHAGYAAEWGDRQFTLIDDNMGAYGGSAMTAKAEYERLWGTYHPPIILGWAAGSGGNNDSRHGNRLWGYWPQPPNNGNIYRLQPIVFEAPSRDLEYFGTFRLINAKQFSQYVSGRFYDPVFYAPKDRMVRSAVEPCFEDPNEFCIHVDGPAGGIGWSSYVLSPAAMFSPEVLRNPEDGGFQSPFGGRTGGIPAGFRSPAMSQTLYPTLKTHMLEHHWLQNNKRADCNPGIRSPAYEGCEPYYFNHAWESSPMTLFYDGHVGSVGTSEAMRADSRQQSQAGYGLWSRDTPFGADGYLMGIGYDRAATSYHVLTTDGIRGRDIVRNPG